MLTTRRSPIAYLAPGAAPAVPSGEMRLPAANQPWPDPDDRLVEPETRQEIVRGQRIHVAPANPGHGDTHNRLDIAVGLCTKPGHVASSDLLTRRSEESDFATDACVRKAGINPATGHRYLEELSFEVFNTQSRAKARDRARDVISSGVRRIFGLFVDPVSREREASGNPVVSVEEWSPTQDAWHPCEPAGYIKDPCLVRPLPVASLMSAAAIDDTAARVLLAKRNPVIQKIKHTSHTKGYRKGKDQGLQDGRQQGLRDGIQQGQREQQRKTLHEVLAHRGIALSPTQQARIEECDDLAQLERWFHRALVVANAGQLLAD